MKTRGPKFRFWRKPLQRTTDADPDSLHAAAVEYFDWAHDTPLEVARPFAYQGDSWDHISKKHRIFSLDGLLIHCGLGRARWEELREDEGFSYLIEWCETVIRTQKFELAAADLVNANLVIRDLGLADRRELSGPDGGPVEVSARERLTIAVNRIASNLGTDSGD